MEESKNKMIVKTIIGTVLFVLAIAVIIVSTMIKRPVVKFVNDDGSVIAEVKTAIGKAATQPAVKNLTSSKTPEKGYRYVFAGWEPSIENIQKDTTVTAKYNKVAVFYTITFELNGGSFSASTTIPTNYTVEKEVNLPTPTREGCTFLGWKDASGTAVTKIEQGEIGNKVFTASWNAPTHKITYELNGGTCDNLVTSFTILDSFKLPTPTKENMVFTGWYTSPDFNEDSLITEIKLGTDEDITLYAEWSYNVTYELDGGFNERLTATTYNSSKGLKLSVPTKYGYRFDGWYSEPEFINKIESIAKGTNEDITLYAKFLPAEDGVVFVENGKKYVFFGSYVQSVVTDAETINALKALSTDAKSEEIEYNGKKYVKVEPNPANTIYQFDRLTYYRNTPTMTIGTSKEVSYYYFNVDPIKWRVISEDNDTMTLFSEYVLDVYKFNETANNDYEKSQIKSWLNEVFYKNAFSEAQQQRIVKTKVDNSASTTYASSNPMASNDTEDFVFLLSYADVTNAKYGFSSSFDVNDINRKGIATEYLRAKGIKMSPLYVNYANCDWMLRSPFSKANGISIVRGMTENFQLTPNTVERYSNVTKEYGVRPAITITK